MRARHGPHVSGWAAQRNIRRAWALSKHVYAASPSQIWRASGRLSSAGLTERCFYQWLIAYD